MPYLLRISFRQMRAFKRSCLLQIKNASPWGGVLRHFYVILPPRLFSFGKPKLMDNALLIRFITPESTSPIRSFNLLLSMVRICSSNTTEFLERPLRIASISIWVGSLALSFWLVIAAAITVGLYRFPISFCTIRTGRIPPCSEPTTGLKSA